MRKIEEGWNQLYRRLQSIEPIDRANPSAVPIELPKIEFPDYPELAEIASLLRDIENSVSDIAVRVKDRVTLASEADDCSFG